MHCIVLAWPIIIATTYLGQNIGHKLQCMLLGVLCPQRRCY